MHGATLKIVSAQQAKLSNNYKNASKEQSMLPEDDRMIETCRNVLSVLTFRCLMSTIADVPHH